MGTIAGSALIERAFPGVCSRILLYARSYAGMLGLYPFR